MCQFEEWPIISKYTIQQAVDDGILIQISNWHGYPVMATTNIARDFHTHDLLDIWREYMEWKDKVEPTLPKEERLFNVTKKGKKVWVIDDQASFTIMYPSDY